jgi:hypothetical protein
VRLQASTLAAAARRQREAELDQARKEAARILQDARVEAGRILAEAKRDADRITGAARAQADGTLASAEEQATATARAGRFGLATLSPQPCPPRGAARAWAGPTILWLFDAIDAHYPAMHRLTRHEPLTRWHYTAGRSWDVKEPAGRAEATTEDAPSGMGRQWARLQDWLSAALPGTLNRTWPAGS